MNKFKQVEYKELYLQEKRKYQILIDRMIKDLSYIYRCNNAYPEILILLSKLEKIK